MTARRLGTCALFLSIVLSEGASAQVAVRGSAPAAAQAETPTDPLGRTTPRGTLRGFLTAEGKGDDQTAIRYLNTPQRGTTAVALAHELYAVLNGRLSVRLTDISDKPEGAQPFPADPDKDLVGIISSDTGDVSIILEHVDRKDRASIWVFSQKTLEAIPGLYAELDTETRQSGLIKYLLETKIARIALIHWVAILVVLPFVCLLGVALNRLLGRVTGRLLRRVRKDSSLRNPELLSMPVQFLIIAFLIRWVLSAITLPLLAREFWSAVAAIAAIVACVWLVTRLNSGLERKIRIRLDRNNLSGALSISRFLRSGINAVVMFVGLLVLLHYFGFNPTTVLAGLGVGGIAIALAAQKTLENVIAGISLISDRAIRVGDFLKVGDTLGNVHDIGLRSTRIRTLDRTMVNMPNGQIANASLENLSLRDQFWFHHTLRLTYETTVTQLRFILAEVTGFLVGRSCVDGSSLRVRFLAFGESSLEVEIFAYLKAHNFADFLRLQEELLLQVMDIIEAAGARIAVPARTIYLTNSGPHGQAPAQNITEEEAVGAR